MVVNLIYLIYDLPNLKTFQFIMPGCFREAKIIEEQVDKLLSAFRTSFSLDEHGWFVRYD